MDHTNFNDFIEDSERGEYHGWQRLLEQDQEKEDEAEYLLQLS